MREVWLSVEQYAELRDISPQAVRKALRKAWHSKASGLTIRQVRGRGGRSGKRYEVLLSSLSAALQDQFRSTSEPSDMALLPIPTPSPKFIAAPNQADEERRKFAVLRLIADTKPRTSERRRAIEEASRHHAVPVRTIERWVKRCDEHGWDLDAMGRKKPSNSEGPRILVSREFDKRWRAEGLPEDQLAELGEWVTRKLAGWWQSPVQRAGWKRVRLETITDLQRHCREQGLSLPRSAFHLSRRRVEQLRFHSIVDVMANDAKRFDDMKPRIRRDNARFEPMRQVVVDVKPLDCVMLRPNGTEAYPKLIAFQDTGTMRVTGRIFLMSDGEGIRGEHVIDAFIAMATNPEWGFPQQIYRDNGKENLPFDLIREALKMTAADGVRVIINAKPYSGSSKPVESRFAYLDRYITSQMAGYTGKDRMNKKIQRVGKKATPYPGTIEEFEKEFFIRLKDLEAKEIESGPFKGRSPSQVYMDHVLNGWRPVSVHPLALDAAFAKRIGERKVDRGAITIGPDRFRHPELAAFNGRKVPVVQPVDFR